MDSARRAPKTDCALRMQALSFRENQTNPKPAEMLANPAGVAPTRPIGAALPRADDPRDRSAVAKIGRSVRSEKTDRTRDAQKRSRIRQVGAPTSPNGAARLAHMPRAIGRVSQKSDSLSGPENRSNPRPAGFLAILRRAAPRGGAG